MSVALTAAGLRDPDPPPLPAGPNCRMIPEKQGQEAAMQILRTIAITTVLLAGLTGCSQTLRTQAATVMQLSDGTEWVLTGDIQTDFELSSVTRLSGDGITCEMPMELRLDRSGAGTMTCRDGTGALIYSEERVVPTGMYPIAVRGTYVDGIETTRGRGRMAFGWGSFADPDYLRGLME
jgi:hypothetical protein